MRVRPHRSQEEICHGRLLLVLLVVAAILIAILAYLYLSLKSQMSQQIEKIRKEQTESARKEALSHLQQWREQELELTRKQQLETARSEAMVQLEQWKVEYTRVIRQEAIHKSQAVTVGKVTEHFVPYLPGFAYSPKDARFLGSPIDFVVFDGLNDGEVKGVVFVEVKTGTSALSTRERRIRDAVQAGRVQWVEIRPQLEPVEANALEVGAEPAPMLLSEAETTSGICSGAVG